MTKLDKPLRRVVDVAGGQQVVVELVPADEGIPAHIKFRMPGAQKSFFTKYIEPVVTGRVEGFKPSVTSSAPPKVTTYAEGKEQ